MVAEQQAGPTTVPPLMIRARAIVLGLLLVPVNAWWVAIMEAAKYTGHPTTYSLYFNCVLWLLALTVFSRLLNRLRPGLGLNRAELLLVYFMLGLGSALAGHDQAQALLSVILYPTQRATPENGWQDLFIRYLHPSLFISQKTTLKALFEGHSTLWRPDVFSGLAKPLFWWGLFTMALLGSFASLSVILRRQWADHEKLTFPLVMLPLEMTQTDGGLWRNPLMWAGFALPFLINLVNNLHQIYPSLPYLRTRDHFLSNYLTGHPWSAIGWSPMWLLPWAVGLGYLLPLDILFSSWVFFFYWKAQAITAAALGLGNSKPLAPYIPEQALGAYLGIATIVVWAARDHLRRAWLATVAGLRMEGDEREALRYRTAVLWHVVSVGFLIWFSIHFGMEPIPAIVYLLGYAGITIAVLRLRAEFGAPVHDLHFADPGLVMVHIRGPLAFSPRTITGFGFYFWFNRAHRSHPGPFFIESLVGAQRTGGSQRRVLLAMILAGMVAIPSAYWAILGSHIGEGIESAKLGGTLRGFGGEAWNPVASWLQAPMRPDTGAATGIVAGYLVALGMFLVRIRFVGFPLHPVGYGISSTWSMGTVWLPLFIAWVCKAMIVRYGGLRGYRRALPFFLGLILGDFISGGISNVIGVFSDFKPYHFLG
ncbi:MAG TPA: hypothetical protein DCZ72_09495 [Armatimonadetes bacterium]|nr:hypothetical protein [Armatimonadota bacterium]